MAMARAHNARIRLGKRIRELRKNLGWSQEKLGEKAELHPTYIGGIERGERNVSLDNLVKIADAFGITTGELFERVSEGKTGEDSLGSRMKAKSVQEKSLKFVHEIEKILEKVKKELKRLEEEKGSS